MKTIIIADGLTPEVFSPAVMHQSQPVNLGRQEIGRLVGIGRTAGQGPLPRFIAAASSLEEQDPDSVRLIFICDSPDGDGADPATADRLLAEPFVSMAQGRQVIPAAPGVVPWREILECAFGSPEVALTEEMHKSVRAIVVGGHTELRPASIAIALKNLFGFSQVAVSSHLIGSATREAHVAALQHSLPAAGIDVILNIAEAAEFVGLDASTFDDLNLKACMVNPPEFRARLDVAPRRVIERLCVHWTSASIRSLQGGFSGSLLFIAEGKLGDARTEPMVIKIDQVEQMRRELAGYYRVKDLMGKHVPAFGFPVSDDALVGIGMELATMEGKPETLQDIFENADSDELTNIFVARLQHALQVLAERLYENTARDEWIEPYRTFALNSEDQIRWLGENATNILSYAKEAGLEGFYTDPEVMQQMLRVITSSENGVRSKVCLSHGDLNYQNIICDAARNIWFIDWTHADDLPAELDFAKLENDLKFVMSKNFEKADLDRLQQFEDYLLSVPLPPGAESLPEHLQFVKWDLRFRKVLNSVIRIRQACFDLFDQDSWLLYRIALLRYSLHTLSFDKRRKRGECGLVELLYALHSTESLLFQLIADDFHLRIRAERPDSYPPRQAISIDEAPWSVESEQYAPPYYVAEEVLSNERSASDRPWVHAEDIEAVTESLDRGLSTVSDDIGRPLHPRGRTGLAGRGLLGRWGANPAVGAVVTRLSAEGDGLLVLAGRREGQLRISLPRGLVFLDETRQEAIARVLAERAGLSVDEDELDVLIDDFYYDQRQTDHAWLEMRAYLVSPDAEVVVPDYLSTDNFDEIEWWPLDANTISELSASSARLVRGALASLQERGYIGPESVARIQSRSGSPGRPLGC